MNKQVTRLAVAAIVLIAALIVGTTYWQTWAVAGLNDRQDNAIQRVVQFTIDRGRIYAGRSHVLLADNTARKVGGQKIYLRRYPNGTLAPHVVGYSTVGRSRAGIEESENDYLTGANGDLTSVAETASLVIWRFTPHPGERSLCWTLAAAPRAGRSSRRRSTRRRRRTAA